MNIDDYIKQIDRTICKNIVDLSADRGLLSQNILSQLRNFVEAVALKVYSVEKNIYVNPTKYDYITSAIKYINPIGKLKFLRQFYDYLQISVSHYNVGEKNSERLILKYYMFLFKIKNFSKKIIKIIEFF